MKKTEIKLTCGDCLFFNNLIHPSEHFTCKLAGYLEYNEPCANFCFNMQNRSIINTSDKEFISYVRRVPTNQLNTLAALLVQDGYNRSKGWSIGDLAYVHLGKWDESISSYVQVVFKGLAGNMESALVEGVGTSKIWEGLFELNALLNAEQWREKHKKLFAEGKLYPKERNLEEMFPGYKYPTKEELSNPDYLPMNILEYLAKLNGMSSL